VLKHEKLKRVVESLNVTSVVQSSHQERRKAARSRVIMGGKLLYGYRYSSVVDLSQTGARVETSAMVHVPEKISFRLGAQEIRHERCVWATGSVIGFEFLEPQARSFRDG
jgi:hypothetical protein